MRSFTEFTLSQKARPFPFASLRVRVTGARVQDNKTRLFTRLLKIKVYRNYDDKKSEGKNGKKNRRPWL